MGGFWDALGTRLGGVWGVRGTRLGRIWQAFWDASGNVVNASGTHPVLKRNFTMAAFVSKTNNTRFSFVPDFGTTTPFYELAAFSLVSSNKRKDLSQNLDVVGAYFPLKT